MVPSSLPASPAIPRLLLERLARPLLARFLSTHAPDFCAARSFPLTDLAASDPRDRALVHALHDLLHDSASPSLPDAARDQLALLVSLACTRGGERLIELDAGRVLPRAKLGDEDLALTAILDAPELARQACALLPTETADGIDGFTEYDPADARTLSFGDAERQQVEALCREELEARDRTRYCAVEVSREAGRLKLEIEYGKRPKTREKLDVDTLSVAPTTDINTERAFAELDEETGRLALHAPHPAIKEVLRKILGRVLAGSASHFTAARVYDLSPFRNLHEALRPHGDKLLEVGIHKLTLRTPAESEVDLSRSRRDLRDDASLTALLGEALAIGGPVAVKLYLKILGRRTPLKVELSAKQGRNRLSFNRSDPEVVLLVRGYLLARGILREIAPAPAARASSSLAQSA
jgi:hypothetical protein